MPREWGKQHGALHLDLVALADAPYDAAEVAEAVYGNDSGVFEGGGEEGARQVRAVMLHEMKVGPVFCVYSLGAENLASLSNAKAVPNPRSKSGPTVRPEGRAKHLVGPVDLGIARDGDVIGRGSVEACSCSHDRQSGPMFDSVEPFFFEGGCQPPAAQHGRGSVAVECVQS